MWFRIELNKDYSVASCASVESSRSGGGKQVHYIEADTKEAAIKTLLARYERGKETRREAVVERTLRLQSEGLCNRCGARKCSQGLRECEVCRSKRLARKAEVRAGAPPLAMPLARTPAQKAAMQKELQRRDIKRAALKANGCYIVVRVAYARCLQAFDTMRPSDYRLWLAEQLHEAQRKERTSAERRTAIALAKSRAA